MMSKWAQLETHPCLMEYHCSMSETLAFVLVSYIIACVVHVTGIKLLNNILNKEMYLKLHK
jgi:hypothetical protein